MGERFRTARRALGLTQQDVAENLCDRSYVSLFEKDKVSPPVDLVIQLANRVHISLDELVGITTSSRRTRSQLLYIDDLVAHGQISVACQYMEQLWWDATQADDMEVAQEIYQRVQRLLKNEAVDHDLSWPTAIVMWLLNRDRSDWAINLGHQMLQILFSRGQWPSAVRWGKTLLRLSPATDIRIRIGVGTASALLRQGDFHQAEQQYVDVLRWIPDKKRARAQLATAWVHHGLSAVYGRTNAWQKAYESAELASSIYQHQGSQNYWLALQNLGIIRGKLGDRNQAVAILSKCKDYWAQVNDTFRINDINRDLELL